MMDMDVFCIDHYDDKATYAEMSKIAKTLDKADFLPTGYLIDEERYPRTPLKDKTTKAKDRRKEKTPVDEDSETDEDDPLQGQEEKDDEDSDSSDDGGDAGGTQFQRGDVVELDDDDIEDLSLNPPSEAPSVAPENLPIHPDVSLSGGSAVPRELHFETPTSRPSSAPSLVGPLSRPRSSAVDEELLPRRSKRKTADRDTTRPRSTDSRAGVGSSSQTPTNLEGVVKMIHDQNIMMAENARRDREQLQKEMDERQKNTMQMMSDFIRTSVPFLLKDIVSQLVINPPAITSGAADGSGAPLLLTQTRHQQTSGQSSGTPSHSNPHVESPPVPFSNVAPLQAKSPETLVEEPVHDTQSDSTGTPYNSVPCPVSTPPTAPPVVDVPPTLEVPGEEIEDELLLGVDIPSAVTSPGVVQDDPEEPSSKEQVINSSLLLLTLNYLYVWDESE
jgi:hypothetical protein